MIENTIMTKKAIKVIMKKLRNESLTQQDSNYLSRFVRPKLRDIISLNAENLLRNLEYNPKAISIERKIKSIILSNIKKVEAIIICGSAIQSNYKEYNDIDIIIATKSILKNLKEKEQLIDKIERIGKENCMKLDIQIYSKESILLQYTHNPSLIYQLRDSKVIYGNLKIPNKLSLSNIDLKMKLDWSEGLDINSKSDEIYYAIRNAYLVMQLMNKKVDNYQLKGNLVDILGNDIINNLKNNSASKEEKKLALNYLISLISYLEKELNNPKWQKIEIENL